MTLGQIIAEYRQEHGLSQRQFGALCGFSTGYASMLEKGINPSTGKPIAPTIDKYIKIADAMGIEVGELMRAADDMPLDIGPLTTASPQELELIQKFRQLDLRGKNMILRMIDAELSSL